MPKRHPSQSQAMKALLVIHLRPAVVVQASQHFYHLKGGGGGGVVFCKALNLEAPSQGPYITPYPFVYICTILIEKAPLFYTFHCKRVYVSLYKPTSASLLFPLKEVNKHISESPHSG